MKRLTDRQREVLALACCHPSREVARLLGISEQTVKNHMQIVYRKLGVTSRTQAAMAMGWLIIPPNVKHVPKRHRRHADGGKG